MRTIYRTLWFYMETFPDEWGRARILAANHHGSGLIRNRIKLKSIEELDLDGFFLNSIPREVGNLTSLNTLILGKMGTV